MGFEFLDIQLIPWKPICNRSICKSVCREVEKAHQLMWASVWAMVSPLFTLFDRDTNMMPAHIFDGRPFEISEKGYRDGLLGKPRGNRVSPLP